MSVCFYSPPKLANPPTEIDTQTQRAPKGSTFAVEYRERDPLKGPKHNHTTIRILL